MSAVKNPFSAGQTIKYSAQCTLALTWGMIWAGIAGLFLMSVVGIPIGIALLGVATWPFARIQKKRSQQIVAWRNRDKPLVRYDEYGDRVETPWVMDDEE